MIAAKVSEKGQVVIPKEIRDKLKIRPGDTIVFKMVAGKLVVERIIGRKMKDILKAGKPVEPSVEFQRRLRDDWE
ncbi:MAG: AbrB/MazE/SpoVT family DNA-binding domain-containing protein [Candidatus Atabeyarchaeum deiterrae]